MTETREQTTRRIRGTQPITTVARVERLGWATHGLALSPLERRHVSLEGSRRLLQRADGQVISSGQIVLVVVLMKVTVGRPGAFWVATAPSAIGGQATLLVLLLLPVF